MTAPSIAVAPSPPVRLLLWPRVRGLWNRWDRATGAERAVYAGFGLFGVVFQVGVYVFMWWLVDAFHQVEVFGPILTRKLLELLMLAMFGLLCFSNVVTALSSFYLADDLDLVLSLPVPRHRFHLARLAETIAQSSWMMVAFGLPVLIAYGVVHGAGPAYYGLVVLVMASFIPIPAAIGVAIAGTLVSVFPARRLREALVLAGVVVLVAAFIAVRWVRPERLVDAESFESLAAYVAALQAPVPVLLPPRWASDVLTASLGGRPFPWIELGLLVSGAVASTGLARWLTTAVYDRGRARSQEARTARLARAGWLDRVLAVATSPLPAEARAIVAKDVKVFFRDPAQWSQVFLLASIVVITLTSIAALPLDSFRGPWRGVFQNALAFLVLGLVGFVLSAVAARFQFPAVSTEGRAFWNVRVAPVDAERFLWAKTWPGMVPMFVVGEVLAVASTRILGAGPWVVVLAAATAAAFSVGISGLAVGMGATFPDFRADSASRAASGPAGVTFMVSALTMVAVVIALEAWPVYRVLAASVTGEPLSPLERVAVVALPVIALAGVVLAGAASIRNGARRLWRREDLGW